MTIGSDSTEEPYTFVTSQRKNRKDKKKVQVLGANTEILSQQESDFDSDHAIK